MVAAGRLAREKGFGRMVDAFAPVARAHPDWQLHIYGEGAERGRAAPAGPPARARRTRSGCPATPTTSAAVLAGAAAYALTSRAEGFPMVLIEAMSAGVPLVAMDCPRGPGEIVDDGKNGFLVDDGDVAGFSAALRRLVEDDELRRALRPAGARRTPGRTPPTRSSRTGWHLFERLDA